MARIGGVSGYRMLLVGIAISLTIHLFWISMIDIVSATAPEHPLKFTSVTFLGPILSGVNMQVQASPADRSMLEKRYKSLIKSFIGIETSQDEHLHGSSPRPSDASVSYGSVFQHSSEAGELIGAVKIEPECRAE